MRVLILTNLYPPHHYGGYELSCQDVVQRWRAAGHHVDVLTSRTRVPGVETPPHEREAGVRRDLVMYWRDHRFLHPLLPVRAERANQKALRRALAESRPDVVSVWHLAGLPFGLLSTLVADRVPLAYVVCDDWLSYGPLVDPWMRRVADRPRLAALLAAVTGLPTRLPDVGRSGSFCFVSATVRERAERDSRWRYPTAEVVPSGIDPVEFPVRDPVARDWGWRLLYVGRLDERKGVDTAIRAVAELPPQTRLDVLGRGDDGYLARLRRLTAELDLDGRVGFGVVPRAELADRYAAADVLLFPVRWAEPFGLVPIEAMACATPVVATGAGGSAEFLTDGQNCLLTRPDDPAGLAAAVRRLAGDPALRDRLVAGGRRTAAELTVDRYAHRLEAIHRAAAQRVPPAPA